MKQVKWSQSIQANHSLEAILSKSATTRFGHQTPGSMDPLALHPFGSKKNIDKTRGGFLDYFHKLLLDNGHCNSICGQFCSREFLSA